MNTLKKDWKADLGIGHVLQASDATLSDPATPSTNSTDLRRSSSDGFLRALPWLPGCSFAARLLGAEHSLLSGAGLGCEMVCRGIDTEARARVGLGLVLASSDSPARLFTGGHGGLELGHHRAPCR